MSWEDILKVEWDGKHILNEILRKDIVKDLGLDVESVDFKDEDMLVVKLNSRVINKYDSKPKDFSDTSIELFLDVEFRNLELVELKDDDVTENVVHTFNKEDIIINTDDLKLKLGVNNLDFYFDDYYNGKLYLWVTNEVMQ
tara:strand:- start:106 stop:528 length:423 start_codon:yes stop_codon:yes gene_type:complete